LGGLLKAAQKRVAFDCCYSLSNVALRRRADRANALKILMTYYTGKKKKK
jgi:hypothetical protein